MYSFFPNAQLAWATKLCPTVFSNYKQTPEGAWLNPNLIITDKDNAIWHNTALGKRAAKRYTTTGWENDFLSRFINNFMVRYEISPDGPLLDIGCGDGRVTRLCREAGFRRIIGIDIDAVNVCNAAAQVPVLERDSMMFVQGDALDLPFVPDSFRVAISSALPFKKENIISFLNVLSKKSIFVYITGTSLESALAYSLVRGDIQEFLRILHTETRSAAWDNKEQRYGTERPLEIIKQVEEAGFTLLEHSGVPIFASLVFGGVLQDKNVDDEFKEMIYVALDKLESFSRDILRQHIFILCKR